MARFPSIPPSSRTTGTTHIPPAKPYVSAQFQFTSPFEPPTNPYVNQGSGVINQGNSLPASAFQLKWVQGTTVKKCYKCGGDIQNPPVQRPDDLVVVCRDFRGTEMTEQLRRSSAKRSLPPSTAMYLNTISSFPFWSACNKSSFSSIPAPRAQTKLGGKFWMERVHFVSRPK